MRKEVVIGLFVVLVSSVCIAQNRKVGDAVTARFENPFGFVYEPGPSFASTKPPMDRLADAGIGWVRLDAHWRAMEPIRGQIDWSFLDWQVDWAEALGLRIMLEFIHIPSWANGTDPDCDIWAGECSLPPVDDQYFIDFVTAVANRYRGSVDAWSMWREANYSQFWSGTREEFVEKIVKPGYVALKSVDPTTPVVGPNTLGSESLFERVMRDACDFLDIAGIHFYQTGSSNTMFAEEMFAELETHYLPIIEQYCSKAVPLWITELGVRGESLGADPNLQGYEFVDVYERLFLHDWVDKAFIYRLHDHETNGREWGLVKSYLDNYSDKPSYFIVRDWLASVYAERIVALDESEPGLVFLSSGSGTVRIAPQSAVTAGLPWLGPTSSSDDNWNVENDAVNGLLTGLNAMASFPTDEDSPEIAVTLGGLPPYVPYDLYLRFPTRPGAVGAKGVHLHSAKILPVTVSQFYPGNVLQDFPGTGWQEWESSVGVVCAETSGSADVYMDDDGLNVAVWSGLRLTSAVDSPGLMARAGLIFADGFESGDTSQWVQ